MYGNRPARTQSFTLALRSTVGGSSERQAVSDRPRGRVEKQARKGNVFAFTPDPTFKCCNRKHCSRFFTDPNALEVKAAREPLYDKQLGRDRLRTKLKDNWNSYLRLPDGRKCCKRMMLKIYNCSSSLIYGDMIREHRESNPQAESNSAREKIGASIASWLHLVKETADCMPDEGWYQLNIPLRAMVHANYNEDAAEEGSSLEHCKSMSYFYSVWNTNFPELRLRKHCRFAKCDFCVNWRRIGEDWKRRGEARERLRLHRAWANVRERGLWHKKRDSAINNPDEAISISIDGMCVVLCVCVYLCIPPPFFDLLMTLH